MRFAWLLFFLALPPLAGQTNDRRRFESEAYLRGRQIQNQVDQAYWRSGAFYASPTIGVRDLGYDENVFATEFQEIDDVQAAPEAGLETFLRISPIWVWANRAAYQYLYYADLEDLRGSQYDAESRLHGVFRRIYFDLGYAYRQSRLRTNSEIDDPAESQRGELDINLAWQASPRGFLEINAGLDTIDYEENASLVNQLDFSQLERDESRLSLRWLFKQRARFWPFVGASLRRFDFKTQPNPRDDSQFAGVVLGARNPFDSRTHYNVKVGVESLSFDNADALDTEVLTTESLVRHRATRQWDVIGGLSQQPIFSGQVDYLYFLSRRAFFGVSHRFRNGFRLAPTLAIGENDYDQALNPALTVRQDDIRSIDLNLTIPLRQIDCNIGVSFLDRESNIPGLSDDGVRISANLLYRPRRLAGTR